MKPVSGIVRDDILFSTNTSGLGRVFYTTKENVFEPLYRQVYVSILCRVYTAADNGRVIKEITYTRTKLK